jgi:hypothetical protein
MGWKIATCVARRADAAEIVRECLITSKIITAANKTSESVLHALERYVLGTAHTGVLLAIDELGKSFEHASHSAGDIYFLQQLAELASRSNGRLMVLGILHQSFDEYARRLAPERRDEWSKVQGRFLDIPMNASGPEQLEIIAQAITHPTPPSAYSALCKVIGAEIHKYRPETKRPLADELTRCWPLHPVTTCLLGPISRRRFAQNQRSLFGFLNSREQHGFQDFLSEAGSDELYTPQRLWDYLSNNLEATILASPDGHRWSLAVDAIQRSEAKGGRKDRLAIVKTIALLDLFRERSGLYPTKNVLKTVLPNRSPGQIDELLGELVNSSTIVYRQHLGAFAIYAGSDFDIEKAVEEAKQRRQAVEFEPLRELVRLRPIIAKKHYFHTVALRWFNIDIVTRAEWQDRVRTSFPSKAMGQFLLALPTQAESHNALVERCISASRSAKYPLAIGVSRGARRIGECAAEVFAVDYVLQHRPELHADTVAKREVEARLGAAGAALDAEVRDAFDTAVWYTRAREYDGEGLLGLSKLASELADSTFRSGPRIRNELLNRTSPSSNAVAALKALLRAMVTKSREPRLGIEGFPAEGGLYSSILEATGLHRKTKQGFAFLTPLPADPARLTPLWEATDSLLAEQRDRPVALTEIYEKWGAPPFGVRDGLKPILSLAYCLSRWPRITVYRDSQFEPELSEVVAEVWFQEPASIQWRAFDLRGMRKQLLQGIADVACELWPTMPRADTPPEAIDVARALFGVLRALPKWSLRTQSVSTAARDLRTTIQAADDPNRLLFEHIPEIVSGVTDGHQKGPDRIVRELRLALRELGLAYEKMLRELEALLLRELGIDNQGPVQSVHERAKRVQGVTGDFRLEAFIARLSTYSGTLEELEGIASLAANKPSRDWSDADVDRARLEFAQFAQVFNRAEAFARVKGRPDGRHAIALVIGLDRSPAVMAYEFEIPESSRHDVLKLARKLERLALENGHDREVILGALAQLGSDLLTPASSSGFRRKTA